MKSEMDSRFYAGNRQTLYDTLPDGTVLLLFSGKAVRKTADEFYPFYASRNFVYLTGIDREDIALLAVKEGGAVQETLFLLPPDLLAERWTGTRLKADEARRISGVESFASRGDLPARLTALLRTGRFAHAALDLYRYDPADRETDGILAAEKIVAAYAKR